MKKKKEIHVMVRDDLKFLALKAPVSESGGIQWTKAQRIQMSRFHGKHRWEWLHWIMAGKSQLYGPLHENLTRLHTDVKACLDIVSRY